MSQSIMRAMYLLIPLIFFNIAYGMNLAQYRWKNRPLVITKDDQKVWQQQQKALSDADLKERDVVVLFDKSESFKVVLYGKDGQKKLESKTPISQEDLNTLIDSMPMRQSEMRK